MEAEASVIYTVETAFNIEITLKLKNQGTQL